jgi:hypothetical protein
MNTNVVGRPVSGVNQFNHQCHGWRGLGSTCGSGVGWKAWPLLRIPLQRRPRSKPFSAKGAISPLAWGHRPRNSIALQNSAESAIQSGLVLR